MKNNYDSIAPIYDFVSKMVFGNTIMDAQIILLKYILENNRVLIIGGGTGKILEEISKIYPCGLDIDYVEISEQMLMLSRKRDVKNNRVNFIHQAIESFESNKIYDVIITPFLFDNFQTEKAISVFYKLDKYIQTNGLWLYIDFVNSSKLWHKSLLKTMYLFFKITSHIEANTLEDMSVIFNEKYNKKWMCFSYNGFIQSIVYQKR